MKKYTTLIIWITALILIFTAAYVVYEKYKSEMMVQPPVPNVLANSANNNGKSKDDKQDNGTQNTSDDANGDTSDGSNIDNSGSPADGTGPDGGPDGSPADGSGSGIDEVIMVPDFTLKDLDGKEVSLSDHRGKIVVLNFWAVWCKYCIEEMPDFNKLNKELEKAGDAVILTVNVQEPYDTVKDYIAKNDIGLKVLLDEDGYVAGNIFGVSGYPTTFIVNEDGSLYTYIPGKTDLETMRTVLDMARENAPLY